MQLTFYILLLKFIEMLWSYKNVKNWSWKKTGPGKYQKFVCPDNAGQNI